MSGINEDIGAMAVNGPIYLQENSKTENSITVRVLYSPNGGQTGSRFRWEGDNGPADFPTSINTHVCTITGLSPNTTYKFQVYGLKNQEESVFFMELEAATAPATSKPESPTNLNGSPTKDSIVLTWNAVPNATLYKISHGLAPNGAVIKTEQSTSPAFTIAGLNGNTEYFCEVRASNNNGDSDPRRIIRKTLLVPPAPTELKATPTNSTIYIEWKASPGAGYYFYRYSSVPGGAPQTFDTTSLNATLTNLTKNTLYLIEVCGVNGNGTSPWTPIQARTENTQSPPKPGPVLFSGIEQHSVRANWSIPGSPSYRVSYGVDNDEHKVIDTLSTNHLTVLLSGLAPGTRHFVEVRGFNAGNVSEPSSNTVSTLVFEAPKNLSVREITDESAVMVWEEGTNYPAGVVYLLYLNGNLVDTISEKRYAARGLTQGTSYEFKVYAKKVEGWLSVFTASTFETLAFEAPKYLSVREITDESAVIVWSEGANYPSGVLYQIYLNGELVDTISEKRYAARGLTQNTAYEFKVCAKKVDGRLSAFTASTFKTLFYEGPIICAPGYLSSRRLSSTTARLDWQDIYAQCALCPDALGFKISVEGRVPFEVSAPPCEVTGLSAEKRYLVEVRAIGSVNNVSAPSHAVIGGFANKPGALTVAEVTSHTARLKWSASTGSVPVVDYLIDLDGESIASTRGLEYPLTSLASAKAYTVQVRARTVESTLSDPVQQVFTTLEDDNAVPDAPTNFRYRWSGNLAMLQWDAPLAGPPVSDYRIELTRTGGGGVSQDSPYVMISFLLPRVPHHVTITARNAGGNSSPLEADIAV
ncbi:hypothetical protein PS918_02560 [Pseudomonas fluorescens]|uniref:Fibronectin type-III domain-containing protein n=1 Tax=Pseudomonas fluorescens TaxID=294 RepID=A0A5E7SCD4_PSEFL|nr:fibronectin type III domain-containing protein [Pseudomonas fluorescens]VVP83665.1 hypothetical protein PS918_02560 [Pseudomonas fluorescens]